MKPGLHVAYVCADRGVPIGGRKGASTHVVELTKALTERGAQLRLVSARTADGVDERRLPAPVIDVGSERAIRRMRQTLFADASTTRQRTRAAEAYGLLLNHVLGKTLDRLHRRWRIDAVYERYSLWSYAGAEFSRAARIPYLLEVNAPLRDEQRRYRTLENPAAAASLESYLLGSADHVIVPSAVLRTYVVERGARPRLVRIIPNAADPALFRHSDLSPPPIGNGGKFVVGFAGSLKPWHGVQDLPQVLRSLRRLSSDYHLLIVGEGPLRPALQRAFRRYGLGAAVTFTGEVDHDHVPALLAQMNVGLAPYPRLARFYFSPLKIFEYMAAGVPVVASEIGQISEVLEHRRSALLHRPGAQRAMVSCIEKLRQDPALAARLAREARRLLGRRFTWRRNAERVLALITGTRRRGQRGR